MVVNTIRHWLEPPVFDGDEEKTFKAGLLNTILLVMIIFITILLPVVLPGNKYPLSVKIIDFIILIAGIAIRHILFKGKVKETGRWLIISCFLLITGAISSLGSIRTPTTESFLFLVIIAGILFGLKGIILTTIASSAIVGIAIIIANTGLYPEKIYPVDHTYWIMYTMMFGLGGGLTYFTLQATVKALERSKKEIAERKQAELKLRASEARFRNLFEQTHDAVIITNLEGQCLDANMRAADMLGYSVEQISALSLANISANTDLTSPIVSRLLAGEHIPNSEMIFRKKDGTIFPVEIYFELVQDTEENSSHMQIVARDISQRKQDEDAIRYANEQLNRRIEEVERLHQELKEQAIRDPLTGLYNRRYLNEILAREIARVEREKDRLSIVVADIDHFKRINDTYGHQVGDLFLVEIARLSKSQVRNSDIICRYGGEEFILVLPGLSVEAAVKRSEDIRQLIENSVVEYQGKILKATISLGIATYPDHGIDAEDLTIKADQAMYQSKQRGRNQVTIWREEFDRGRQRIPN